MAVPRAPLLDQAQADERYLPSGGTTINFDASVRFRRRPFRDVTHPDYGAVGDGVTDDRAAIQAALDLGGWVFLPPDLTFVIGGTLVMSVHGTQWIGSSKDDSGALGTSTIRTTGAFPAIRVSARRGRLADFYIDGNNVGTIGVVAHDAARTSFERLMIKRFTSHGLHVDTTYVAPAGNCNLAKFYAVQSVANGGAGYHITFNNDQNGLEFIGCEASSNTSHGMVARGQGGRVFGGHFEQNGGYGIVFGDTADSGFTQGWIVFYPWLEANTLGGVRSAKGVRNGVWRDPGMQGISADAGAEIIDAYFHQTGTGAATFETGIDTRRLRIFPGTGTNVQVTPAGTDANLDLWMYGKGTGGVRLGASGTAFRNLLTGTATWDPPSLAAGATASTTVTVTGAGIGDPVAVGFSQAVPAGALLVGAVTATNTVTVTLLNQTGATLDLASGTVRATVVDY